MVRQRNRLLRLLREGRAESTELEFWDDRLVSEGAWLSWQRTQALNLLARLCADHHRNLSSPGELLTLEHLPSVPVGQDLEATAGHFRQALAGQQARELATGSTAVGPHRDDFKLLVDGVDMGTFASRGQARTIALTLRLAEASYLSQVRQDEPVVLLDDVLSEMDEDRRPPGAGKSRRLRPVPHNHHRPRPGAPLLWQQRHLPERSRRHCYPLGIMPCCRVNPHPVPLNGQGSTTALPLSRRCPRQFTLRCPSGAPPISAKLRVLSVSAVKDSPEMRHPHLGIPSPLSKT